MDNFVDYHPSFDGIRGWLLGIAVLLLLAPLALVFGFADDSWRPLTDPAQWAALTSTSSVDYDPRWRAIIYFNAGAIGVLVFASVIQLVLFFRHSRFFPKLFVGFMAATLLFILVSTLLVTRIPAVQNELGGDYALRFLLAMVTACGSIAYMLRSPRVRFTFTR